MNFAFVFLKRTRVSCTTQRLCSFRDTRYWSVYDIERANVSSRGSVTRLVVRRCFGTTGDGRPFLLAMRN